MKLTIKYLDRDKKIIENSFFEIEFEEDTKKEDIAKTLDDIEKNYIGDESDNTYYFVTEAVGFACYLNDEQDPVYEYGFGVRQNKKEPLAFADGLIRRCKVSKLKIKDKEKEYIIENLGVDSADDKCISAETFKYSYDKQDDSYISSRLNNVVIRFLFQDSGKERYVNKAYVTGTAPYLFILKGELGHGEWQEPGMEESWSNVKYSLSYDESKSVYIGNKVVPFVVGNIKYDISIGLNDESKKKGISGIFFGGIVRSEWYEDSQWFKYMEVTPLMAVLLDFEGEPEGELKGEPYAIIHGDLEKYIKGSILIFNDPERGFKEDVYNQVNDCLVKHKICLNPKYKNFGRQELDSSVREINYNFTGKIVDTVYRKLEEYYNEYYNFDDVRKMMEKAISKVHIPKNVNELSPEEFERFCKNIVKKISGQKDKLNERSSFDTETVNNAEGTELKYSTAVHEMGHAVAVKFQYGNNDGIKKITIIEEETMGGYVKFSILPLDDKYQNILNFEKAIRFFLASRAAEEHYFGTSSKGWSQDYRKAQRWVIDFICNWGEFYSSEGRLMCRLPGGRPAVRLGDAIDELIDIYMKETREMLADKMDLIRELSCAIMKKGMIDGKTFNGWYSGYFSKKETQKLCDRMWLAIDTVLGMEWKEGSKSKELIDKLTDTEQTLIKMDEDALGEYVSCTASEYISQILGFNPFEAHWRRAMYQNYSRLTEEVASKGVLWMIKSRQGGFRIFMDYSDRISDGESKGEEYSKIEDLSYYTIDDTNAIYSK